MQAPLLHEGGLAWRPERVSTVMVVFYVIHHRGSEKITIQALRGEGDRGVHCYVMDPENISIHALRGEGDRKARGHALLRCISIHALRGEGDR